MTTPVSSGDRGQGTWPVTTPVSAAIFTTLLRAWICQAWLPVPPCPPPPPSNWYNSAIITGGAVNKILVILTTELGLWLGGAEMFCLDCPDWHNENIVIGEVIKGWRGEERPGGWGAIWQGFILGVMTLHFRSFWEINLIRKWSPTVASFEFQMFTIDEHYCMMLGIMLQGGDKNLVILELFQSSSSSGFHRGVVSGGKYFWQLQIKPPTCFASYHHPTHYPSFLQTKIVSGWWGLFIDLDDTLSHSRKPHLDVCHVCQCQLFELAPFHLVRHNNIEAEYWWHCWNRNGLRPSQPVATDTNRQKIAWKLKMTQSLDRSCPACPAWPPTDHQYQT